MTADLSPSAAFIFMCIGAAAAGLLWLLVVGIAAWCRRRRVLVLDYFNPCGPDCRLPAGIRQDSEIERLWQITR